MLFLDRRYIEGVKALFKGPNIYLYISYKTATVVGLTPSLKSQGRDLRNSLK